MSMGVSGYVGDIHSKTLNDTYLYHLNCILNLHKPRIYHQLHAPQAWATGGVQVICSWGVANIS